MDATTANECGGRRSRSKHTNPGLKPGEKGTEGGTPGVGLEEEEKGFDPYDLPHEQRRRTREGNAGSDEPTPKRSKPSTSSTESRLRSTSRRVSFADPLTGLVWKA